MKNNLIAILTIAGFSLITSSPAHAEDLCRAKALRDVSPMSGGGYVIPQGSYVTAVTQYIVDDRTGERMFCSHGGGCYPEYVTVDGRGEMLALELENCAIGPKSADGFYSVEVDRTLNSSAELRFNDIEDQLISFGMALAPADNAARHYVNNPEGECGRLVRNALEGNPEARRTLSASPRICVYTYE